jgi:shikimate dehydrogenase
MLTTNRTYRVGLIGAGIRGSLSPALHEREAACQGVEYGYEILDTDRLGTDIGSLLRRARDESYDGLNVTHPFKQRVIEHLDELSGEAQALGAVNTVVLRDGRAVGHNTDAPGFAASFERGLPGAALDHVALIGAGGAGAAVAHALRELGAARLTIIDRDHARAARLAGALRRETDGGATARHGADAGSAPAAVARPIDARAVDVLDLAGVDGVVNASPTGMVGHGGTPVPPALLHRGLWVADVVYRPLETELLRDARAAGCRTLDGGGMVVLQAAGSFELFTGIAPDRERMLRHFASL